MCLVKLIKFKEMTNTHYRAKSNGIWVFGYLYNNCDRGVTPSGIFSYRNSKSLISHSGFIGIDIDTKDQIRTDFNEVRNELQKDNYTYSLHDSVSGSLKTCSII